MQLIYQNIYYGPNPYAEEPVLVALLCLKQKDASLQAARSRLQAMFPQTG